MNKPNSLEYATVSRAVHKLKRNFCINVNCGKNQKKHKLGVNVLMHTSLFILVNIKINEKY